MNKIQTILCNAHKCVGHIQEILGEVALKLDKDKCNRTIIESYAILNANIPLVKMGIEDILESLGIIASSDIVDGVEITKYYEEAKPDFEPEGNTQGNPEDQSKK